MRRIVIALGATLSGLVLLFSWPTSLNQAVNQAAGTGTPTTDAGDGTAGTASATDSVDTESSEGTESSEDTESSEGTDDDSSDAATDGSASAGTSSGEAPAASSGSTSTTYTGAAADTRYGPVQVEITVTDGVVTAATAIDFPSRDRHDQQINSYAIPILQSETVDAQSASIDMVSGATVTSRAYVQSLQDALDQAGL